MAIMSPHPTSSSLFPLMLYTPYTTLNERRWIYPTHGSRSSKTKTPIFPQISPQAGDPLPFCRFSAHISSPLGFSDDEYGKSFSFRVHTLPQCKHRIRNQEKITYLVARTQSTRQSTLVALIMHLRVEWSSRKD